MGGNLPNKQAIRNSSWVQDCSSTSLARAIPETGWRVRGGCIAGGRIPQPCCAVGATGGELEPIRAERHPDDLPMMRFRPDAVFWYWTGRLAFSLEAYSSGVPGHTVALRDVGLAARAQ